MTWVLRKKLNSPPDVSNEGGKQWAPILRPSLPEDLAHLEFASQGFTCSNHRVDRSENWHIVDWSQIASVTSTGCTSSHTTSVKCIHSSVRVSGTLTASATPDDDSTSDNVQCPASFGLRETTNFVNNTLGLITHMAILTSILHTAKREDLMQKHWS
jgi:hypothetical protein